jgi:hypothetical protein
MLMIDDFSSRRPVSKRPAAPPPEDPLDDQLTDQQTVGASPAPAVEPTDEPTDEPAVEPTTPAVKPKMPAKRHLWPQKWSPKQKRLATGGLVVLAGLLLAAGFCYWRQQHKTVTPPIVKLTKKVTPKPTTEPSRLTGLPVAPALNLRPVTGVMIENSPDARPQSGLTQAGIVYEAVAEGGITRFLALFQDTQPDYIGPIRSARPYYLDWLLPFDAAYAHVGGSPEALAQIKSLGVKDMDQFFNAGAYSRVSSRYAPHNVYTSMAKFDLLEKQKGYTSSKFTSFARKPDHKAAQPTAVSIDINISSYLYHSHYDYDVTANSYKRSEGGKPHVDERSGLQIEPKVVLALVMPSHLEADDHHSAYDTVGSGPMTVFQDGIATAATWSKPSRTAQFSFTDSAGQTLKLNAGQTWIVMVDNAGQVSYKP